MKFDDYKREHPDATFAEYYVAEATRSLATGKPHPTLGDNLRRGTFRESGRGVFKFLCREGLKPSEVCVDYGCGSLRIGQHLMRYLDPGNYWGLDVTDRFLKLGIPLVGQETIEYARPHLHVIDPEVLQRLASRPPDVVFALGVLLHVPPGELAGFLGNLATIAGQSTRLYLTVDLASRVVSRSERSWVYSEPHLREAMSRLDLSCRFVPTGKTGETKDGIAYARAWMITS